MRLACLTGHRTQRPIWNAGLVLGHCDRCGKPMVRLPGKIWFAAPKGYVITWKKDGAHAGSPRQIFAKARAQAPILHKLPRRRRSALDAYYL